MDFDQIASVLDALDKALPMVSQNPWVSIFVLVTAGIAAALHAYARGKKAATEKSVRLPPPELPK